jgi:hypothetical protein
MKKSDLTSMLSRTLNALSKGVSNMDAIAWLTALYIAVSVGVMVDDHKSKEPQEPPKVEQTK